MFTGMIEGTGTVISLEKGTLTLKVPAAFSRAKKGASVAVNGACLTVVRARGGKLSFNVVRETLRRTALGALKAGERVNLERPLKAGGRLEGHFVLGHVDGVGVVRRIEARRREKSFLIAYPARLGRYLTEKGSVAVDGVSLTLGKVGRAGFWIHLMPHTLRRTTLGRAVTGTRVNLEADVLAKLAVDKV